MIVPSRGLLISAALTLLPLSLAPALLPPAVLPLALLLGGLICAWGIDAWLTRGADRRLRLQLPERLDLTLGRTEELPLRLSATRPARLALGLALPPGIASDQTSRRLALAEGESVEVAWPIHPLRRGRYRLGRVWLRIDSPFGFWGRQTPYVVDSRLHVYPDLGRERRNLASLFLNRWEPGDHRRRPVGQGREFEKLRDYLPGDSLVDIHWKATAKRNHPVTKEFRIERTQEIYLVVDASRLSARTGVAGGEGDPLIERFLSATLALGLVARREGDLFGLVCFDDRVRTFLRAKSGQAHFNACREAIFDLQARMVAPDYRELATFLNLNLRRRALLIILTCLDDPALADDFSASAPALARRHLVLAAMPRPAAARPLFTEQGVANRDDLYRHLAGHLQWQSLRELQKTLRHAGVALHLLNEERLSAEVAARYLDVKRRQLL